MCILKQILILSLVILNSKYLTKAVENSTMVVLRKFPFNENNKENSLKSVNFFKERRLINQLQRTGFWRTANNWEREYSIFAAVNFRLFNDGEEVYENTMIDRNALIKSACKHSRKISFILHGWRQSCETDWVLKLIERLSYHRGGCIVCIDYSSLAEQSYMRLYRNFRLLSDAITKKIMHLIKAGLSSSLGYMFGFSFGGQLATSIGRSLQPFYMFENIDTCDMAGPGFDLLVGIDHRDSANHVHCFHSSRDKGTRIYACHQNVRFGNCGYSQPAVASQPYFSSHGLCVQIYINAFDFPFYAMKSKPKWCVSRNPARSIPPKFTVGYSAKPNSNITGDIFVPTSPNYPYNLSEKEISALENFLNE